MIAEMKSCIDPLPDAGRHAGGATEAAPAPWPTGEPFVASPLPRQEEAAKEAGDLGKWAGGECLVRHCGYDGWWPVAGPTRGDGRRFVGIASQVLVGPGLVEACPKSPGVGLGEAQPVKVWGRQCCWFFGERIWKIELEVDALINMDKYPTFHFKYSYIKSG